MLGEKKPRRLHTVLEARVALEAALHFGTKPLHRFLPQGDHHPVLVIPAFMSSDGLTAQFRQSLDALGYDSYGWELGINSGIRSTYLKQLELQLKEIVLQRGQPVSIIGWSLGGLYARALANQFPDCVRQVITLGSPFAIPSTEMQGVNKGIAKLYSVFNDLEDPMLETPELWQQTPPVPFTGIYTESDGIIHWHYCLDRHSERSQNIRVLGSHVGLTHNPLVLYLVAERLQYRAKHWRPFAPKGWQKLLFSGTCASEIDGADLTDLVADGVTVSG